MRTGFPFKPWRFPGRLLSFAVVIKLATGVVVGVQGPVVPQLLLHVRTIDVPRRLDGGLYHTQVLVRHFLLQISIHN